MGNQDNRDIAGTKLLILHKQHYLQDYPQPLKSEYSCMGYFDGMDIIDVEKAETTLFTPKCNSGISDMWYQSAGEVQKMAGYVGSQNIGMFRCAGCREDKEKETEFWSKQKRRIFMTVSFLQLSKNTDQEEFRRKLEEQSSEEISLLGYFTFDNADLILFIQGNSFYKVTKKIEQIDKMPEVRYIHPINGVHEESLKNFEIGKKDATFYDMEKRSLVNDDIKELRIEIVGYAGEFEGKLKYILDRANDTYKLKNYDAACWAYMTDHENYVFLLKDTDMRTALILMISDGVVTHQNGLFGSAVYNMETKIRLEEKEFKSLNSIEVKPDKPDRNGWCRGQIGQYREYMKKAWKCGDQGIYSYCQAIIQTLNTLAQFEDFELSRNIFYIIYPAFKLFSEQLKCASKDFENISQNPDKITIKNAMLDFLDSINSIVYHAIHMDQIYLMIPGCSGTTFSIPTKLSLFYLWFIKGVSKIMNDTSNQYEFYLTPVMESKPCTYPIEFGLPCNEDRLVCVKVSQRSLYIPGELLIILTHEMAHYVGKDMRSRVVRWEKVKATMAALMAEAIIPCWCVGQEKYLRRKYRDIYKYTLGRLQDRMEYVYTGKYDGEILYHASTVAKILKDECAQILADENGELKEIVKSDMDQVGAADVPFHELIDLVSKMDEIAEQCDRRRIGFLGKGDCDRIIDMLLREYQEIFADIAAFVILQFEQEDYSNAYNISEGCKIDDINMPNKDYNRKRLLLRMGFPKEQENTPTGAGEGLGSSEEFRDEELINYWSNLDIVQNNMREYVEICKKKLEKHISKPAVAGYVDEIRKAYFRFSTSDFSCQEIYSTINLNAGKYAAEIQEQLENGN